MNKVICGDCLEVMKDLPNSSVSAIITDPPYELGFMGKSWDNTGIANKKEMWTECLRVLKPGGHLLSFGGTRTYHRMAVAIEDAGFEVRDMIEWVYGSGFPKSLNIGKAVDKLQGNERESLGIVKGVGNNNTESMNSGVSKTSEFSHEYEASKGTSEWEGWGTALKPAHEPVIVSMKPLMSCLIQNTGINTGHSTKIPPNHEPICMARKPLAEKTVAENVLKYGCGGINIDLSRVEAHDGNTTARKRAEVKDTAAPFGLGYKMGGNGSELGRFPANLITDGSEEVRECFPESKSTQNKLSYERKNEGNSMFIDGVRNPENSYTDSGNASRFFKSISYNAKASKSERNKGCEELPLGEAPASARSKPAEGRENALGNPRANNHPTVKPTALMEYLIRMVSKENDTILDPFAGSGTTGVACKNLNRQYILIEKEPSYIDIINKRLQ
jgi:site-specific DNA-methyltransferase (adenine-specific)